MDPLHMGECSMGFYIDPAFRQNQLIVNAVNEVTKIAFTDHECHRLQSIVVDNDDKLPTLELLASA
jgi:RimJ/RimL family protein N-acetyltransferase